jgi:hypothetical protein
MLTREIEKRKKLMSLIHGTFKDKKAKRKSPKQSKKKKTTFAHQLSFAAAHASPPFLLLLLLPVRGVNPVLETPPSATTSTHTPKDPREFLPFPG